MRWWLFAGLLALVALEGRTLLPANRKPNGIERSLDVLEPAFRVKLLQLLANLQARGFRPLVWETLRDDARANILAADGSGKKLSMHRLGQAADIIDAVDHWEAAPEFWEALHDEALKLGLTRIRKRDVKGNLVWDLPHVQAMPGNLDARMNRLSAVQRTAEVEKHLG